MKPHRIAMLAAAMIMISAGAGQAAKPPATWDNLVRVPSKKLDLVYLQPGADFRGYKRVMIDTTEVALRKNWVRDYNSNTMGLTSRVSDSDVRKMIDRSTPVATEIFAKAFTDAGYPVVTEPGDDVLRVRTGVINISVNAPDRMTAGRSRTYSEDAGEGTLVVEVRDSVTGALLGRAVDRRIAGDNGILLRNSVTNRSDFRTLTKRWAKISVNGLTELKTLSPISGQ